MKPIEYTILNNHLTEYPQDKSFEEVLTLIFDESEEVIVWEPFEDWNKKELVNHMRALGGER